MKVFGRVNQCVPGLLQPASTAALCPIDSPEEGIRAAFVRRILLFAPSVLYLAVHAPLISAGVLLGLQSGWLSETIRTGDGRSSLPLDSVPHSICKAFHLWWSSGLCAVGEQPRERQQGNRLCNVFGRVFFFFLSIHS